MMSERCINPEQPDLETYLMALMNREGLRYRDPYTLLDSYVNGTLSVTVPGIDSSGQGKLVKIPQPAGIDAFQREVRNTALLDTHASCVEFGYRNLVNRGEYFVGDYFDAESLGVWGVGNFALRDADVEKCKALVEEIDKWQEFPANTLSKQDRCHMKPMFTTLSEYRDIILEKADTSGLYGYLCASRPDLVRLLDDFFNNSHLVELVDAGHDKPVLVHGDLKPTNIFFDDSSMPTFFDIEDMRVIDNRTLGAGYDFGRLFTACSDEHALQRRLWAAWCGPERDTDSVVTAQLGILYWTIHGLSWYVSHAELRHKVAPYMVMLEKTLDGSAGMSVAEFAGSDTVTPSKLIRRVAAVPELRSTYEKDGAERIPLTIHSERVVGLFEKYFADSDMAQKYGRDFFRLFFGLHDAGKPRSIEEARPEMEHQYTTDMIIRSAESLGLRTSHLELMSGLLAGDPVGEYIQGKIPTEVAGKIVRSMAEAGDVPVADMAAMVEMYFMCDAGSYTAAAGGDERLDHLFVFDPSKRKVAFAASIESMMRTLRMQF